MTDEQRAEAQVATSTYGCPCMSEEDTASGFAFCYQLDGAFHRMCYDDDPGEDPPWYIEDSEEAELERGATALATLEAWLEI